MIDSKEFRKYAVHHQGLGGVHVDKYIDSINGLPSNFTPAIIEERKLNIAQMDVFSRLMMDRIIFFGVPVTDYTANVAQAQLLFLESADRTADVSMYINSPGGSVIAGLGLYDTMQLVEPDIRTICTGLAASFGAVLLCAGTKGKRSCLKHARVMIHQPLGGMQGQVSDMEISYKLIKQMQSELYEIISNHTGQKYDKIADDSDRDYWMRGEEAKEYGIVDEVLGGSTKVGQIDGE